MKTILRRVFRPTYGTWVHVRPKKWWSPKERRSAEAAGRLLDWEINEELKRVPSPTSNLGVLTAIQSVSNRRLRERMEWKWGGR
jgi:hypothetical protein